MSNIENEIRLAVIEEFAEAIKAEMLTKKSCLRTYKYKTFFDEDIDRIAYRLINEDKLERRGKK